MFNLGLAYSQGKVVNKDYGEAAEWMKQAAWAGDSKAEFNLGLMYAQGRGLKQSYECAYAWLDRAHSAGISRALIIRDTIEKWNVAEASDNKRECPEKMPEAKTELLQGDLYDVWASAPELAVWRSGDKMEFIASIADAGGSLETDWIAAFEPIYAY